MYYALFYELCDDYMERRQAVRSLHFEHLTPYHERGQLLMAGAFDQASDGAMLLFKDVDRAFIERFAQGDPYVAAGVVTGWKIAKWNVAVGQ